jgi:hypothetical protein
MPSTYKAVEVTSPGKFTWWSEKLSRRRADKFAFVCRPAAFAIQIPRPSADSGPAWSIPAFLATRPLASLRRLDQECPDGALDSASAWVSLAVKTGLASPAAAATS